MIGEAGQPFYDPAADAALFTALRRHLRPDIAVVEVDATINDQRFADACVLALLETMRKSARVETT